MKIDRKNYEKYFVDYLDGLLDKASQQELFAFLEKNQDLKTELEEVAAMDPLQPEHIVFRDKNALKRIAVNQELDQPETLQQQLIEMIEGELSMEKETLLKSYLSENAFAAQEQKFFEQTL